MTRVVVWQLLLVLVLLTYSGIVWAAPTEQVMVRDMTHQLSVDALARLSATATSTLAKVSGYWGYEAEGVPDQPIVVEYVRAIGEMPSTFFFIQQEGNRRIKVVRVIGGAESPRLLAHKLTSALFPHKDKLIRNMMGEESEKKFGNPASFPACGMAVDEWVAAFINTGSYIPLDKIGTAHEDWGMTIVNNMPVVKDFKKQHICYAEAGSFGQYLIDTFGRDKVREFYSRTSLSYRPWQEVFGLPLAELEQQWLARLKQKTAGSTERVNIITAAWLANPQSARYQVLRQALP